MSSTAKQIENAHRWRENNPGAAAESVRRWRHDNPAAFMLATAKNRAKTQGREFSLTLERLEELLRPMRCVVTGMELSWETDRATYMRPRAPSIDRRDSSLGYTNENCQVVAWAFNSFKQDMTQEQAVGLLREMASGL